MDTEMQPLISVIVPVYNAEPYLKQCIESVVSQIYRNLEIILVDDGSTDGSSGLCDAYATADPRIKVIHKENEGLVRARKTGVSQAGGDYITFVDADDWIDPDTYKTVLGKMTGQGADLILYGMVEEYEDRSVRKENQPEEGFYVGDAIKEKIYPTMLCSGVFFRFGIIPNLFCKIIKRELMYKVQMRISDEVEFGEDVDCTFQMILQANSIMVIKEAPYHYRKIPNSMVWRKTAFERSRSLYQDLKAAFRESMEREILVPQLYRYMLFVLLLKSVERFLELDAFVQQFLNKRIVLYGAGGFGQELYRVLTEQKQGEIVLWVDKGYQTYCDQGLPVDEPEAITGCMYDMVFIAVLDTKMCEGIAEGLVEQGVCREKISFIEPTKPYMEMLMSVLETGWTD